MPLLSRGLGEIQLQTGFIPGAHHLPACSTQLLSHSSPFHELKGSGCDFSLPPVPLLKIVAVKMEEEINSTVIQLPVASLEEEWLGRGLPLPHFLCHVMI